MSLNRARQRNATTTPRQLVVHLITKDQPRGAELVAAILSGGLNNSASHRLLALQGSSSTEADIGAPSVVGPRVPTRLAPFAAGCRIAPQWHREPPDVVVAHGAAAALAALLATRLARIGHTKVIWHRILRFPSSLNLGGLRAARLRWIARRVDGVIALTLGTANEVRDLGYSGCCWIIPNHRPRAEFSSGLERSQAKKLLGIPVTQRTVGFIGHLVEQKNPLRFGRVAVRLLEQFPEAEAVVLGDGPLGDDLKQLVNESAVSERFRFLGHVESPNEALRALDIVVSTSVNDSLTGALIEAAMSGCAIVAIDNDGLDLLLGDGGGALVASSDQDVFQATAVLLQDESLLSARQRSALSRSGDFDSGMMMAAYEQVLASVAGLTDNDPMIRSWDPGSQRWVEDEGGHDGRDAALATPDHW